MNLTPEPVHIEVVAPNAPAATAALRCYIDEVASRYQCRQATDAEIDYALRENPSDDLAPPHGEFLVARRRDVVLGCAGLRLLPEGVGELERRAGELGLSAGSRRRWPNCAQKPAGD